jgi:dTDP-4-amino-4,6-dideoxygalactose transaminase
MIPFNRPTISPMQADFVTRAFDSRHLAGDGAFTKQASQYLSDLHNGSRVLLTTSCTAALEMSALLLDLQPGDEVIVPSFTFVSSANAFVLMGAQIVFADIDDQSLNISAEHVRKLVSPRTRAVVAVNYGGVSAVTDELIDLCAQRRIDVIEDNAHGLFGQCNLGPLGTSSVLSTLSFHETKNVTCGEGGALIINDVDRFAERAEIIREKGTNRSRFFRGMVDKYTWVDKGSSYLLSDINAAVLMAQLLDKGAIQERRRAAYHFYESQLIAWSQDSGFELPHRHKGLDGPFHLFPLLAPSFDVRERFLAYVKKAGVACTFHYLPLHLSPAGRSHGVAPHGAPVTESVSDRLVRLPVFSDILPVEYERVVDVVTSFK